MKRWVVLLVVFLLIFAGAPMTSLAQEKESENKTKVVKVEKERIKKSVEEALDTLNDIDISGMIQNALESSRIALEQVDIDAQVKLAMQDININEIVQDALETAQIALENVDINAEVSHAMEDVDISQIIEEAMIEVERALEEVNIEETVREALEEAKKDIKVRKVKRQPEN